MIGQSTWITVAIVLLIVFSALAVAIVILIAAVTLRRKSSRNDRRVGLMWCHSATQDRQGRRADKGASLFPLPPHEEKASIFVSVPSYRDPETWHTIRSAFARARNPRRVHAGVFYQRSANDADVLEELRNVCKELGDKADVFQIASENTTVLEVDHMQAKGPTWARQQIQEHMYGGEDFMLWIDSHTMFAQDWDVLLLRQWVLADDCKAVITVYPEEYKRTEARHGASTLLPSRPYFMAFKSFESDGMPTFESRPCTGSVVPQRPFRSIALSAGFCLMPRSAVVDVPCLKNTPNMFYGEEYLMALRLWTHGYSMYSPTIIPVYTLYDRSYRPTFWELDTTGSRHAQRTLMNKELQKSLRAGDDPHSHAACAYVLGDVRSLQSFYAYCGVDITRATATDRAARGLTACADTQDEEQRIKSAKSQGSLE